MPGCTSAVDERHAATDNVTAKQVAAALFRAGSGVFEKAWPSR